MDDQPFDKLTEQSASGLKNDRELYLDVKQELRTHLEEKAEQFAREGHDDAESADLAKKSFGSPLDVAADLLNANKRRMKLRALFRLTFGALIVPVAVLLALYLGYGRFARLEGIYVGLSSVEGSIELPTLPFYGLEPIYPGRPGAWNFMPDYSKSPRQYWEAHRQEPDARIYYAYYAPIYRTEDERQYVDAMRLGERIEPRNALYNILLTQWYLDRGILPQSEKPSQPGVSPTDDLLDKRMFELGISELQKAMKKPYLHTYKLEIARKRREGLPPPLLTEDYLRQINLLTLDSADTFPLMARYRGLARKIPGCARLLLSEGRRAEAEGVMDTWRPFTKLLLNDPSSSMIFPLVVNAVGGILAKSAPEVYNRLGETEKAQDARQVFAYLTQARVRLRSGLEQDRKQVEGLLTTHGPAVTSELLATFMGRDVTEEDLAPSRMHEYVILEEIVLDALLAILGLALAGALIQGAFWLCRIRRSDSVPLLLVLPAGDTLRAILLGILLPMVVYWVYSRLPIIGGREYGLHVTWHRFALEMLVLGLVMFWVPVTIARRRIRRRCADLDIPVPSPGDEGWTSWMSRRILLVGALIAAAALYGHAHDNVVNDSTQMAFPAAIVFQILFTAALLGIVYKAASREKIMGWGLRALFLLPVGLMVLMALDARVIDAGFLDAAITLFGLLLATALVVSEAVHGVRQRREHGLYFGTMARSLATIYAFSILLISLTIQPWMMYNEVNLLRQDKLVFGHLANTNKVGMSLMEEQAINAYTADLRKALEGK